jgi:hypothetical protein
MKEKDQEEERSVEVVEVVEMVDEEADQRKPYDKDGEPLSVSLIGASNGALTKA